MQGRIFAAVAVLGGLLVLGGCATGSGMSEAEKLASYEAAAGEPVKSFTYLGRISGWSPLDEHNIAVWTRPKEAWLLTFSGPCPDIEYTPAITLTNQTGRVYAGFDKVVVHNSSSMQLPCRIDRIRPLDTARIKAAEKAARDEAQAAPSGT